jgi:GntR family transcriptional regulator
VTNEARSPAEESSLARLDSASPVPLYQQMVVQLQSRMDSGEFGLGAVLPGELDLSRDYGVSRITAKRALDELAEAGLVKRERGRGTRVLERPGLTAMRTSIDGWLENINLMQSTTEVKLLSFDYLSAGPEIASAIEVPEGTEVQRSVRVRTLDGAPMSYLVCFLPGAVGRSFGADELRSTAMLKLLERAGHSVTSARQTVSATLAAPDTAQALNIHAGAPLLEVRRIARSADALVVQYIRALYRPELYHIEMSMTREAGPDGPIWSAEEGAS